MGLDAEGDALIGLARQGFLVEHCAIETLGPSDEQGEHAADDQQYRGTPARRRPRSL